MYTCSVHVQVDRERIIHGAQLVWGEKFGFSRKGAPKGTKLDTGSKKPRKASKGKWTQVAWRRRRRSEATSVAKESIEAVKELRFVFIHNQPGPFPICNHALPTNSHA